MRIRTQPLVQAAIAWDKIVHRKKDQGLMVRMIGFCSEISVSVD